MGMHKIGKLKPSDPGTGVHQNPNAIITSHGNLQFMTKGYSKSLQHVREMQASRMENSSHFLAVGSFPQNPKTIATTHCQIATCKDWAQDLQG